MNYNAARNDPCPCGSGKKYKHCHMRPDEADAPSALDSGHDGAVERALSWLAERHRKAFKTALGKLMDELIPAAAPSLSELGAELLEQIQINMTEWLLADGEMFVKGPQLRINAVLLGPDGPGFSTGQRHWLAQLAEQPLWLYSVTEVRSGEGVTLCDALDFQALPVAVQERAGSATMKPGMVLGCRVVPTPSRNELSGAMYPFSMLAAQAAIDEVRALIETQPQPENQRTLIGLCIARSWARQFTEAPRMPQFIDAQSGEPMLLVTDHYRVIDASALALALAACADVDGDEKNGWYREFEGSDGQVRSQVAINPGKRRDRIELFYRTQRHADDGRAWFDGVAAAAVKYLHREISSPQDLPPLAGANAKKKPRPALPPEAMAQAIEQVIRRSYANWADEPIPALDRKTPRQAMQTAAGLERVKGLLRSYESGEAEMAAQQGRRAISYHFLWAELGIER